MIRMVISDVDGTLVGDDKTLSPGNIEAVRRLSDMGVPVTLVSARPPSGLHEIIEQLALAGPFAAFNGGVIFNRDKSVVQATRLDEDIARRLYDLFCRSGVVCWLYADGDWVMNARDAVHTPSEILSAGVEPIQTIEVADRFARTDKLVAVSDDTALLTRIEAAARAIAGDRATIARSQPYYLDVTALGANKGDAVATLAAMAGIPLEAVAVLGDQDNDVPMFVRAGYAVAMGQGSDAARSAADAVAGTNADDGVADAIDRLLMPQIEISEATP